MHRNTYLLVSALSLVAVILAGVNIGRKFPVQQSPSKLPTPSPADSPVQLQAQPATKSYQNRFCRLAFDYPSDLTVLENASGSAAFTGKTADEGIILTCQGRVPRPSVPQERIENIRIGSVSATLYHARTASEGAAFDSVIFTHPQTQFDVFLAGAGESFRKLILSLSFIP